MLDVQLGLRKELTCLVNAATQVGVSAKTVVRGWGDEAYLRGGYVTSTVTVLALGGEVAIELRM